MTPGPAAPDGATPGGSPSGWPTAGYAPLDDRPNILDYDASKPIPPGYTVETRLRKGLLISGSITFALGYMTGVFWAESAQQNHGGGEDSRVSSNLLYIPVLGPWIAIPTAKNGCSEERCKDDRKNAISGLVLVGATQVVGATLMAFGFVPSKRLVRTDLTVTPVFMGQNGYGVGMAGTL